MNVIIGLAGVKTSGKSTVANIIKEVIGTETSISEEALADKLKNVSAEVFGVPRNHFDDQSVKEVDFKDGPKILTENSIHQILTLFNVPVTQDLMGKYQASGIIGMELPTPRKIAQVVGTEVLRATGDEDIHCKNMPLNSEGYTIVSDLRFPNEFNYFHTLGVDGYRFIPLYVQRDEAEKHVTKDSHPSETSVFLFSDQCKKLSNNGSLEDLKKLITNFLVAENFISQEVLDARAKAKREAEEAARLAAEKAEAEAKGA